MYGSTKKLGALLGLVLLLGPGAASGRDLPSCQIDYSLIGALDSEREFLAQVNNNLLEIPRANRAITHDLNIRALEKLNSLPMIQRPATGRSPHLNIAERNRLYRRLMENPQVNESLCGTYGGSKQVGFCFGRAMAAHIYALKHTDLQKESIRKVWFVGKLEAGGDEYKFHVTTAVRGLDGKWYAIDPFFDEPLELSVWYRRLKAEVDTDGSARLYSTRPGRAYVKSDQPYNHEDMARPSLGGFFEDLLETIRNEK